ncbi:universal stress protein [Oscillatoria sp. HE19RPO]|uniref:universal stress protein n=1 Tax=Oscillatoria sp. HE19RPO TaxID=2954806 RepID=UPI0020C462D1|nr:universal stress protein [Oscillatoria sp. HE19RPO]
MKKILICTDGSLFAETIYRYGADLATKIEAEIDVLSVTDIRSKQAISTGNFSGSIGIDASENLLNRLVELEHEKAKINHQRAKLILQTAASRLKSEGVDRINLIHKTGFLVDCLDEFEASSDLIVLGKRGEAASFASSHLGANLERIVRSSRKPCLVVPLEYQPIDRVLLAYDGSSTAKKMLQFIGESPLFKGVDLHIVKVATSKDSPTVNSRLQEAEQALQGSGFKPVICRLEGEPEKAIASYITEQNISLLLMGAYGHSRIRHLVIGSTTAQMLRSSKIPVLLFR